MRGTHPCAQAAHSAHICSHSLPTLAAMAVSSLPCTHAWILRPLHTAVWGPTTHGIRPCSLAPAGADRTAPEHVAPLQLWWAPAGQSRMRRQAQGRRQMRFEGPPWLAPPAEPATLPALPAPQPPPACMWGHTNKSPWCVCARQNVPLARLCCHPLQTQPCIPPHSGDTNQREGALGASRLGPSPPASCSCW